MKAKRHALVLGAGASLAAPAGRPMFAAIRDSLIAPLDIDVSEHSWRQMAPEALLSRLKSAGIDIDDELRRMLSGGEPNALHYLAAAVLKSSGAVWTTNFDELIEDAAQRSGVAFHRLLPDDNPACECGLGHLAKVHGTLSGTRVVARSEDVLLPLPSAWLGRLRDDLDGATVALVGYAGADIDLRTGLRDALTGTAGAVWFGTSFDELPLGRRFANVVASGALSLRLSGRPDLEFLQWGEAEGLVAAIPTDVWTKAQQPVDSPLVPRASYRADDLLRARMLDDFGHGVEARRFYRSALRRGPNRRRAARAVFSSGLIHGAPWRSTLVRALDVACAAPLRWHWPHHHRLVYLTWNTPPAERWAGAQRALEVAGDDAQILLSAANAAKEVEPRRAVQLAQRAQRAAEDGRRPADAAWATFTLSMALRWLGDIAKARTQAARLSDGIDALAGPVWVAWGHFEAGAVAALDGHLAVAQQEMQLAYEVFAAAGSRFEYDALCGAIAVHRAAGDMAAQRAAYAEARRLVDEGIRTSRFAREVLMVEDGEFARQRGQLEQAESVYAQLSASPTAAQHLLGLLGLGEVQRARAEAPEAARRAFARSQQLGFGYGEVHAAVTLGLAGAMTEEEAESCIAASLYDPVERDDVNGLLRYCVGPDPEQHLLCFP